MFCTKHFMTDLLTALVEYLNFPLYFQLGSLQFHCHMHLVITSFCFGRNKNSVSHVQYIHTISMLKDKKNYVLSVIQSHKKTKVPKQEICLFLISELGSGESSRNPFHLK